MPEPTKAAIVTGSDSGIGIGIGKATAIAQAVVFLAGEGATYATGSPFVIDGGLLLMAAVRNQ